MAAAEAPPKLPSWSEKLVQWITPTRGAVHQYYQSNPSLEGFHALGLLAPPPPFPEDFEVTKVEVPRVPVPGLETKNAGTIPGQWQVKNGTPEDAPVVLYLHAGAYSSGRVDEPGPRFTIGQLVERGIRGFGIEYRLSFEEPFPAALADAVITYKWLLSQGIPSTRIVLFGDSAGFAMAYSLGIYIRDQGLPAPGGIAGFTCWADLTLSSPSELLTDEFDLDVLQPAGNATGSWIPDSAITYVGDADKHNPLHSPLFDAKAGLPPQFLIVGDADRCYAETLTMASLRTSLGETVALDIIKEMPHVYHWTTPGNSYDRLAAFIKAVAGGRTPHSGIHRFAFPSAGGASEGEKLGMDDVEGILKTLFERAQKAGVDKDMDAAAAAIYKKAAGI